MHAEKRRSNSRRGGQSLRNSKNKACHVLKFTTAKGKKKMMYFGNTDFFGK